MSKAKIDELDSDSGKISTTSGVSIDISGSEYDTRFPKGGYDTRPASPIAGAVRLNTDENKMEFYDGNTWNFLDGSKPYVTENLRFYIDAAFSDNFNPVNILQEWKIYAGRTYGQYVLAYDWVKLLNTSTDWIGYFPADIYEVRPYTLSFDYYADAPSVLILDNDGLDNNVWNTSFNADTTVKSYSVTRTPSGTGSIQHFFRRSSGGNIWVKNVRFTFEGDGVYDISGNSGYSSKRFGGLQTSTADGGYFQFDGSNDYIDIPDFNYDDISMEIVIRQNPSNNKALEFFGSHEICNSTGETGFAYFPANIGLFYYRFFAGSGDRPHVRAGSSANTINLSDGNWHHLIGTYKYNTNTVRFYHNGQFINESSSQVNSSSFQGNIGGNATSYALNGDVGLARIYNSTLSDDDVVRNYNDLKDRFSI